MVLEKLSLDPVIVGTLSVVAVAVLWLMGVRGADLAAAGILIVGVMTLFGDRYPIMRVAVLVGSVVVFIAIMTGVIPKTVPPLILLSAVLPCVVLVYTRPIYSNEDTESADDMEEAIW